MRTSSVLAIYAALSIILFPNPLSPQGPPGSGEVLVPLRTEAPLVIDVSAGWGLWFYKIDGASQAGLPVVSYEYMNFLVGAAFDIKAVDPWLSIDLGVTLRIPHKWGLGSWTYGDKAAGFGASAVVGLSGPIAVGLGWSAGFEYTGIMTKHSGPCEVTDGTCLTSDKSSDHYLAGFAKLTYAW